MAEADPARVALLARSFADGLQAGGVAPVIKHLPGHGRAVVDSHLTLPVVGESLDELRRVDFAPFKALAGRLSGRPGLSKPNAGRRRG